MKLKGQRFYFYLKMNTFRKVQYKHKKRVIISLIIGILSLIILIGTLSLFAWEDNFLKLLLPLKQRIYPIIGGTIWEFSAFSIIPFSLFGIFLVIGSARPHFQKLVIFAILLNSINLIFSLFIAWLLFGLARGM